MSKDKHKLDLKESALALLEKPARHTLAGSYGEGSNKTLYSVVKYVFGQFNLVAVDHSFEVEDHGKVIYKTEYLDSAIAYYNSAD